MMSTLALRSAFMAIVWAAMSGTAYCADRLFVSPSGAGNESGHSWESAAPLTKLPDLLRKLGGNGTVFLRADAGPYRAATLQINSGAPLGSGLRIRGVSVSLQSMKAEIVGTRSEPYDVKGSPGQDVFRLGEGAQNIEISDVRFKNVGTGIRVSGPARNITVRDIEAINIRRMFDTLSSKKGGAATVNGLSIARVHAKGFSKTLIRVQYDSSNIVIEDVYGDSDRQDGDNFASGVVFSGTAHDALVRRVEINNCTDTKNKYQNGDGFSAERGNYRLRFEKVKASGNTDSGMDLKSYDTTVDEATLVGNKRNLRVWGKVVVDRLVAKEPFRRGGVGKPAQVHLVGSAELILRSALIEDSSPTTIVFDIDGGWLQVSRAHIVRSPHSILEDVEEGGRIEYAP